MRHYFAYISLNIEKIFQTKLNVVIYLIVVYKIELALCQCIGLYPEL